MRQMDSLHIAHDFVTIDLDLLTLQIRRGLS